jgi:ribose 5-phosphate isomerase A
MPDTGTSVGGDAAATRAAARDRVAAAALGLVEDGMTLGLGTGDSARRFVDALARRVRAESLRITCVATSNATADQARAAGLDVRPLPEVARVDVAFDGADEVDPGLDLIKGGGGALTREKIVAASADRFVVLVDAGKLVEVLGAAFPLPVEVVPEAVRLVAGRLEALGGVPVLRPARSGEPAAGPFVTDLGHSILDARFPGIPDPASLSAALDGIPGIVGHGLFVGFASLVLVGELDTPAVRRLPRTPGRGPTPQGGLP